VCADDRPNIQHLALSWSDMTMLRCNSNGNFNVGSRGKRSSSGSADSALAAVRLGVALVRNEHGVTDAKRPAPEVGTDCSYWIAPVSEAL
jgi:hypothetical protein